MSRPQYAPLTHRRRHDRGASHGLDFLPVPTLSHAALERHQVWLYLFAALLGVILGYSSTPATTDGATPTVGELLQWVALALLLYATFLQIPLREIPQAFRDRRFLSTALVGNFLIMPLVVGALLLIAPQDPAVHLGLVLVLVVPCTDWFITFTQLGGGDGLRATVLTPVNLLLQFLLLPLWIWLFVGDSATAALNYATIWPALLVLIVPLVLAAAGQLLLGHTRPHARLTAQLAWWPVPLLALVIGLAAHSSAAVVIAHADLLLWLAGIFLAYASSALLVARMIANPRRLPAPQARTVAFTLLTRNSFVVLPIALALPVGWELAAVVVVLQSLVELMVMMLCIRLVPALFRAPSPRNTTTH